MNSDVGAYAGWASHPSLGDAPVAGSLHLRLGALRFEAEELHIEMPWDGMHIDHQTRGPAQVSFAHPGSPEWLFWTDDETVLQHRLFKQRADLRRQLKDLRDRRESWQRLKATAVFLAGFALLSLLGYGCSGWAMDRVLAGLPPSYERELGAGLLAQFQEKQPLRAPSPTAVQLQELVDQLAPASSQSAFPFQVHLADDPDPNACALPGGHIIVNTGLLAFAEAPEEVAGVLAHELAHVRRQHGFRTLLNAAGHFYAYRLLVGGRNGLVTVLSAGSGLLLLQNYSREHEREADDLAWQYLVQARIDPRGLVHFLRRVQLAEGKTPTLPAAIGGELPPALRSHPALAERIARLEAKWASTRPPSEFRSLQRIEPPGPPPAR